MMNLRTDPTLIDIRNLFEQWRKVLIQYTNNKHTPNYDVAHAAIYFAGMTVGQILAPAQHNENIQQAIEQHAAMLTEYIQHGMRIARQIDHQEKGAIS